MQISRTTFLRLLGTGALAAGTGVMSHAKTSAIAKSTHQMDLGLASYTLRELSLDEVIAVATRLQIKHITLKSMHLPLDSSPAHIKSVADKMKQAGLNLYGAGVIYMRTEAEVQQAFDYAKAAGMSMIIGVPNHELLPLTEAKVKETNIKVAIHNHGPGDKLYSSVDDIMAKIKNMDARLGICMDIGHVVRIGEDPVQMAKKYAARIYDLHIKDEDKATAEGKPLEIGRGVIDIPAVIKALQKIKYQGYVTLEYEKDGKDPVPGLAESVGYVRGVMKMM